MGGKCGGHNCNFNDHPIHCEEHEFRCERSEITAEKVEELELEDASELIDINMYQQKKTIAKGFLDIALFSANNNQLRYILDGGTGEHYYYYYLDLMLIILSLIFQVLVGIGLILNTRYNVKDCKEICFANEINNFTTGGIFLIIVINVFTSAFVVATNSISDAASNASNIIVAEKETHE